jgi:hypothetical protein
MIVSSKTNSQPSILLLSFKTFMAAHLLEKTKSLAIEVNFASSQYASHTTFSEVISVKKLIQMLEDPPYLPDLSPHDFFLFPKL